MPWLYDGVGNKDKAIEAFAAYISKYPTAANIPSYMMRIGMLYTEIGKDVEAQKVLSELSAKYPDSPQGKNANFFLARNLYESGSYAKALPIFKEIFGGPLLKNLSVSNLRWISTNLADCPVAQHGKDFAQYSYKASKQLLEKLKKPDFKEWVGDLKAIEFNNDAKAREQFLSQIEQKLQLDAATAALLLAQYDDAVACLTRIIDLDDNTAYFNQVYFSRSEAYRKLKKYDLARKDLNRIGARAMTRTKTMSKPNYGLYNKVQVLMGEIFLEENEIGKANGVFSMVAEPAFNPGTESLPEPAAGEEDYRVYVEQAIYRAAYTASLLGKPEKAVMVEKYRKNYPKGKYLAELDNLPEPQK